MKYFRFDCMLNQQHAAVIYKASGYCNYLASMYEYYFTPVKTGGVSSLHVYIGDKLPTDSVQVTTIADIFVKADWQLLETLSNEDINRYLLNNMQQAITEFAVKNNWDTEHFTTVYNTIVQNNFLFRHRIKKPVNSADKQIKAQIYFEYDYRNSGLFIDFRNKQGELINRIKFCPSGYYAFADVLGAVIWIDNEQLKINYKSAGESNNNTKHYWLVNINGDISFNDIRANESNPQALYSMGLNYYEGKIIIQDTEKGINLIKQAAEAGYKHAVNWLAKNI